MKCAFCNHSNGQTFSDVTALNCPCNAQEVSPMRAERTFIVRIWVEYVKVGGKFEGIEGVSGCKGAGENCIMRGSTTSGFWGRWEGRRQRRQLQEMFTECLKRAGK